MNLKHITDLNKEIAAKDVIIGKLSVTSDETIYELEVSCYNASLLLISETRP